VLDALRRGTRDALGDNGVGVDLSGLLATGKFTATSYLGVLTGHQGRGQLKRTAECQVLTGGHPAARGGSIL
jgi:hypothetical protein